MRAQSHVFMPYTLLLLVGLGNFVNLHGAVAAAGSDLLPTSGVAGAKPALPGSAPVDRPAAAALPSVQAIPTNILPAAGLPGGCAVSFAKSQQCGGNLTSTLYNCTLFNSCQNNNWAGGCCPAASPCKGLSNAGGWCWTCGGEIPKSLAVAAENAEAVQPSMCARLGPNADFDYGCALGASMKFYEAQRSGKLPTDNKVPWRGNTGLMDKAPNGASLAGGWYDAGDMTRFTFPAAFTVSNLALSYLEFPDAFRTAAQVDALFSNLRWAADWLVAARYAPDAFVAVTWAPGSTIKESHDWWGKPEEVKQPAEVRVLKGGKPGADLLAQGAAALAAVSLVFQDKDRAYSEKLLGVARGLYEQASAEESRGMYSDSVPEVRGLYTSYSFIDDLAWGAAWLAMRTKDPEDIKNAQWYFQQHQEMEGGGDKRRYDYNNMLQGVGYLLAKMDPSKKEQWSRPIRDSMTIWLKGQQNITYTPKGMAYIDSWGNLRYVANQAFMALLHNNLYPDQSRRRSVYTCFARKQARIMLGETGRSYVVGVGTSPPCRPHHRAASCGPSTPGVPCDCTALYNQGCNPNTLYGALVGGPNQDDKFEDVRTDFAAAEVTVDWNAGFTGMLAGLAGNKFSWDDCKAAGLQDGRGDISPALSAGRQLRAAAVWQLLLLVVAAVVAMAGIQP